MSAGTDTIISSASSSHSFGIQSSPLNNPGQYQYENHRPTSSPPTMRGRSGSVAHIRMVSDPADYLLPGSMPESYVIYAIANARIYHSTQLASRNDGFLSFGRSHRGGKDKNNGGHWVYSHLRGTLAFGRDRQQAEPGGVTVDQAGPSQGNGEPNGEWWFQLIDDEAGKVVWRFKLPLSPGPKFSYELDRPFFHVFQGSSRRYGFLFDDDKESAIFSDEVTARTTAAIAALSKSSKGRSRSLNIKSNKRSKHKERSSSQYPAGVSAVVVSSPTPNSLKHIAHIGFNPRSGTIETSKDLDPAFQEILADFRIRTGSNIAQDAVFEHLDHVRGSWKDVETAQRSVNNWPVVAN